MKKQSQNKKVKKVKIKLFYDGHNYSDDVTVIVNGETFIIKRGVEVEVPDYVKSVIEDSAMQERAALKYIEYMQG